MMAATTCYLRLVHGWDPLSALLGASPGSMAQVMALSAEFDADVRGIAIVHVMRVLLIVLGLPAGLALFGLTVEPVVSTQGSPPRSSSLRSWWRSRASRRWSCCASDFPAGLMFGALAGSAFFTARIWSTLAALVGRQRGRADAGRGRRCAIREYQSQDASELSRCGFRLIRGRDRGCRHSP